MRLLLSVIRSDDKATRTERRLEDKMAAFREIWESSLVCVNHCIWLVQLSASTNIYFHSEKEVDSGNMCQKTKQVRNQNVDDVILPHYESESFLGKENNEVTRGFASDVFCALVQPISGQDRGGRNVTTDNFFTSVDLANQLQNKKLTLFGTMKENKREIPQEFKPARQRDEN